ncbi:MAG: 3'-5' exonuclease [Boseongicola sp.]|nr:3'-5' exonuclease [Boseongicola sp.]
MASLPGAELRLQMQGQRRTAAPSGERSMTARIFLTILCTPFIWLVGLVLSSLLLAPRNGEHVAASPILSLALLLFLLVAPFIVWRMTRTSRRARAERDAWIRKRNELDARVAEEEAAEKAALKREDEHARLVGLVQRHANALSRNLDKALKHNDYGALVRDGTDEALNEFFWSVDFRPEALSAGEARACVFQALGRKEPGPGRPPVPGGRKSVALAGPLKRTGKAEAREPNDFGAITSAVVVDVETTGLDSERDRIVTLAMIEVDMTRLTETTEPQDCIVRTMQQTFDPGIPIPAAASRIHGLRDRDVRGHPSFESRAGEIRDFIGTLPLIGHNVSFDKKFLSASFKRAGLKTLHRNRSHCTMWRYRNAHAGLSSLDAVAAAMGVSGRAGETHQADEDAMLALAVACIFHLRDR